MSLDASVDATLCLFPMETLLVALLGFLWPVTDGDVDRWTVMFLDHWLKDGGQEELLQAVADKRDGFEHLANGAALVVYGLPLKAKR